jgi:hypothetical protein
VRERAKIEHDQDTWSSDSYLHELGLILETLLDIRDLLVKVEDNTRGHI